MDFNQKVLELAKAKQELQDMEEEYSPILMALATAKNRVKMLDQELRDKTVEYFLETFDKQPHDAIKVKMKTKHVYDEEETLINAVQMNCTEVLKLDLPALKRLEKEYGLSWVVKEEVEEATPYIKEHLGDYLIMEEFDERSGSD